MTGLSRRQFLGGRLLRVLPRGYICWILAGFGKTTLLPLPLARLRGRGQLTELRVADLRFPPGEAAALLNQVMDLGLSLVQTSILERLTAPLCDTTTGRDDGQATLEELE